MSKICVSKGLNIPIEGKPLAVYHTPIDSEVLAIDLDPFRFLHIKPLYKEGDFVQRGMPIAVDKNSSAYKFFSPAGGRISAINRGLKRRITNIVITKNDNEHTYTHPILKEIKTDNVLNYLITTGLFSLINSRPFNRPATPENLPKSIFIKSCEFAPFYPPQWFILEQNESFWNKGIEALSTIAPTHIIYDECEDTKTLLETKHAQHHTVSGPYPASNLSIAISKIDPITSINDIRWTLNTFDVICLGAMMLQGSQPMYKPISISGPVLRKEQRLLAHARVGASIKAITQHISPPPESRIISGNLLTGNSVSLEDFLGFYDLSICLIQEEFKRNFLHFFSLGTKKYSATKTYLSHFLSKLHNKTFSFNTNQHGECRAFVDGEIYNKFMPMKIPVMELIKAIMTENYSLACRLGFLEIVGEDFALPAFICPSKINMIEIVDQGQHNYIKEAS